MKKIKEISIPSRGKLFDQLLLMSRQFDDCVIFNSNDYEDDYGKYHLLAAFGSRQKVECFSQSFRTLEVAMTASKDWWFGHLSYELKDELEALHSSKEKYFDFQPLHFFQPLHLLKWKRNEEHAEWWSVDESELEKALAAKYAPSGKEEAYSELLPVLKKDEYLERFKELKEEISYGNIYEVNFCQSFSTHSEIDPYQTFSKLNANSPMPFSAFYKNNDSFLISASPERFMAKRGNRLICQPIKGTAKRSADSIEDDEIKEKLKNDLKEQTENVMIVDLMRNDLSKTAKRNSVEVKELFGVYSFPQVHQLISTVVSDLSDEHSAVQAIAEAFPMGSMTGAPKIKAMELIEEWETNRRELYSGSVGYFDPDGDFDLSVVIRSLLYSDRSKYLSLTVGGAITDLAKGEDEYNECLLKAKAIFDFTNRTAEIA